MAEGVEALNSERYERALELFRKAIQADWRHTHARLFSARALGMLGRLEECSAEIERLTEVAGKQTDLVIEAGQTLEKFGLFEQALRAFERAAKVAPRDAKARTRAGAACERLHRLEQAETLAREAIGLDPGAHEARLVLARVLRRSGRIDEASSLLYDAAQKEDIADLLHAKLWYELASLLDGQGQYAEAVTALKHAKLCLSEHAGLLASAAEEAEYTLRRLVHELSRERVRTWIGASSQLEPARVAALVGFPRSGTTLLERLLDAHPMIESVEETLHLSTELVTGFHRAAGPDLSVAQVLDRVAIDDVRRCREHYLRAMSAHVPGPLGQRWLLDKNPIRTLMMPVLRRAIPNARIITALRDPRDVLLSNLMQAFEPSAMNVAFLDVEKGAAFYAITMNGWLKLREMIEGWVEVRYEDVVVDTAAEARRVLALLDLPWDEALDHFQDVQRDKAVRSPTYAAVNEQVHTRAVRRFEHYADYLAPGMPHLEPIITALGYA